MTAFPETRARRQAAGITDDQPRCSKCDEPNTRKGQRYCKKCHAAYQKRYRATSNVSRVTIVANSFTTLRGIDA